MSTEPSVASQNPKGTEVYLDLTACSRELSPPREMITLVFSIYIMCEIQLRDIGNQRVPTDQLCHLCDSPTFPLHL